jgi:hypothetical protein
MERARNFRHSSESWNPVLVVEAKVKMDSSFRWNDEHKARRLSGKPAQTKSPARGGALSKR